MFCVTDNQKTKIFFKSFVINIHIPISGLFPRHFALSSALVIWILAEREKVVKIGGNEVLLILKAKLLFFFRLEAT